MNQAEIAELFGSLPMSQEQKEFWHDVIKDADPSRQNTLTGIVNFAVNRFDESILCLKQSNQSRLDRALLLIITVINPTSDRQQVIEALVNTQSEQANGESDEIMQLALSFGYRALGLIDECLDYFPSFKNLQSSGPPDLVAAISEALDLNDVFSELAQSLAVHFMGLDDYQRANYFFSQAIEATPTNTHLLSSYALCLVRQQDYVSAKTVLEVAITVSNSDASLHAFLGQILQHLNHPEIEIFNLNLRAFELDPSDCEYAVNACKSLIRSGDWKQLSSVASEFVSKAPARREIFESYRALAASNLFDWEILKREERRFRDLGIEDGQIADPFICLWFDPNASSQLKRALNYTHQKFPEQLNNSQTNGISRNKGDKIKIGIFSGDFCNHAGMTLMLDLFKSFDRDRFEVFAIDVGTVKKDSVTTAIQSWCSHYYDCSSMTSKKIKSVCEDLRLDVAIDRGGHTGTNRLDIFALRVAPVQIGYLAYPSTTGASYIDYIIADQIVIPTQNDDFFSEKIIRLPMCYQPNSRHIFPPPPVTARPPELPDDAFVLASFNAIHKLRTADLENWAELLRDHEQCVLWLVGANETAQRNIVSFFDSLGVSANRIIFSQKATWEKHQSRVRHADLCLDSHIYGSHTTAIDCLNAGVPIITMASEGFQTRVCTSILTHLALEELVTNSWEEYKIKASFLIMNEEALQGIKRKIENTMSSYAVETRAAAYRDSFFQAIEKAHHRALRGEQPSHFSIS